MALPTSGQLTLAQIRDEFGAGTTSNVSLRTLSSAAGLSVPDGLNEFYGLSAFTYPTPTGYNQGFQGGSGTAASPYVYTWSAQIGSFFSNEQFTDTDDTTYYQEFAYSYLRSEYRPQFTIQTAAPQTVFVRLNSYSWSFGYSTCEARAWSEFSGATNKSFSRGNVYGSSSPADYWLSNTESWTFNPTSTGGSLYWRFEVAKYYNYIFLETMTFACGDWGNYGSTLNNLSVSIWFAPA